MVGDVSGTVGPWLSHWWAHRQGHGPQARRLQSSVVQLGLGGTQGKGAFSEDLGRISRGWVPLPHRHLRLQPWAGRDGEKGSGLEQVLWGAGPGLSRKKGCGLEVGPRDGILIRAKGLGEVV